MLSSVEIGSLFQEALPPGTSSDFSACAGAGAACPAAGCLVA